MGTNQLNHFDEQGNAVMEDVTDKAETERCAVARGSIYVTREIFDAIAGGTVRKGDVQGTARLAGILAAKQTPHLIPLCHPLLLSKASVDFELHEDTLCVDAVCTVKLRWQTGVEMEALTGVSVALLTIYDMCKALSKTMEIGGIHLERKSGGKSGNYTREEENV